MTAKKKDTYSYKGWLNSDNFFKRAFAIFGYNLVPTLIVYILVYILILILIGILAYFGVLSPSP